MRPPAPPNTTPPPTRADVLAYAARMRRAALLLEAHARGCTAEEAAAHAAALRVAWGMVRRLGGEGERGAP